METLLAPLREMEEYTQLRLAVDKGETPVTVVGGMEAQKCHMIYGMEDLADVRLIVTYNEIRARELLEDYRLYDKNVMYYPAKDLIFYSADVHGSAIVAERLKAIQALAGDKPVTIITTIDAGMDACVPYEKYESQRIRIEPGDLLNLEEMQHKLRGVPGRQRGFVTIFGHKWATFLLFQSLGGTATGASRGCSLFRRRRSIMKWEAC